MTFNPLQFFGYSAFSLVVLGLFAFVGYLLKKIQAIQGHHAELKSDNQRFDELLGLLPYLNVEERLLIIHGLMGKTKLFGEITSTGLRINGLGQLPEDEDQPKEYVG